MRLQSIGRFDSPLFVTAPPGDRRRVFVVEQGGRIRVLVGGRKRATPFLDIRSQVQEGSEQGLLSLAFAPDYARSGRFYVYFTDNSGSQRVVEYKRASADRADAGSARLVLRMADPESNHNGGPAAVRARQAPLHRHGRRRRRRRPARLARQRPEPRLAARQDPAHRPGASGGRPYTVPGDNPFVARDGALAEIYSYGLRNPWRFSFDRSTGDLSIGDVGQNEIEEIDFVRRGRGRGANFGWRAVRGPLALRAGRERARARAARDHAHATGRAGARSPAASWSATAALGGLRGRYLFGDFCQERILSARLAPGRATSVRDTSLRVPSLSSFGEDARGRVYATSLSGPVYRLVPR